MENKIDVVRFQKLAGITPKVLIKENQENQPKTKMTKSAFKAKIKEGILAELKEKKGEAVEPINADAAKQEPETNSGGTGEVQSSLQAAYDAAKSLGDEKLLTQIGNSITYFTKAHVLNAGEQVNENEEENGEGEGYTNPNLKDYKTEIENILQRLLDINDELEQVGPVQEEIYDATDSLKEVLAKIRGREDSPIK